LKVAEIGVFAALVAKSPPPALAALAGDVLRTLDPLRAPLTEDDRKRRLPETLSPRQRRYLDQWGYPFVFEEFRFHMTLTGRQKPEERGAVTDLLRELFVHYDQPVIIKQLTVFFQPDRQTPFTLLQRFSLHG
jgi:Protein of unknown function (DUF1045)